jgi:pyruvate,orthophosphate dikinase
VPQSKALEVNLAMSRVQVTLDPKYDLLLEIISPYHGLMERLKTFLKECCHPYRNWQFIVEAGRSFALNNFYIFKEHPQGPEGARLFMDIFLEAATLSAQEEVRGDSMDNLLAFLQQIITAAGPHLPKFLPVLDYGFTRLAELPDETFFLVVRSFYNLNRLAGELYSVAPPDTDFSATAGLLEKYLIRTYDYWLGEADPRTWFEAELGERIEDGEVKASLAAISHGSFQAWGRELREASGDPARGSRAHLAELIHRPGFKEIVSVYEKLPRQLTRAVSGEVRRHQWLLLFLFHIMNLAGLSALHEKTLMDIHRSLAWLIDHVGRENLGSFMDKTFQILSVCARKYPHTALTSILKMGQAVYRTDDSDLVEHFQSLVVRLGFQTPELRGVGNNWQVQANPAHIQNIRVWLELIGQNPRWSKKLLSSLIIYLSLAGVFIKDTDLFPRDITALLNRDIKPVYNLVKQLCRLMPVYFNDIGAEGQLRDISTDLDELLQRRDPLVHFLRKHSHVEGSPRTVTLMEAIFEFWRTLDKGPLEELVPPDIFGRICPTGSQVDGLHLLMVELYQSGQVKGHQDLLTLSGPAMAAATAPDRPGVSDMDGTRLRLAQSLYQILYRKYHTDVLELDTYLDQMQSESFPDPTQLRAALSRQDPRDKLSGVLDYLEILKNLILSGRVFEIREDIFHKRHIAADIPSMYGSYHETKFDALGLTFRLEALVNNLFGQLTGEIDLLLINRATLTKVRDYLHLFNRALQLDGLYSQELEHQLDLLTHSLNIRGFSFTQYLDIFRGFGQIISNIVNDHFNNIHQNQLVDILAEIPADRLLPKYVPKAGPGQPEEFGHRITEIFLRDRITASLGLQQMDVLLARILKTVFHQDHELPRSMLRRLLDYDPAQAVTPLEPATAELADIIHLGSKGYNLVRLKALGLPVPKGFILTTELFRCWEVIDLYPPAKEQFRQLLAAQVAGLEAQTGRKLGDPRRPLLLSVRSGSSISQPGMLNTFLNVGINQEVVEALVARDRSSAWFAWDCYRRFVQSMGMAEGLRRDAFDAIMADFKNRTGLPYKRDFTGEQMKQVALAYRGLMQQHQLIMEDRPFEQLTRAINGVFDSWTSSRAETYRKIMNISGDWGTAVTVQAMVFGNLSQQSGSGVCFTHNPRWSRDKLMLWGDFALGNQGEDVVSGLVETLPITEEQRAAESRTTDMTLETHFPEIYRFMRETAKRLIYELGYGPQEMEFTFESPRPEDFYYLQTRDMVLRERPKVYSFDVSEVGEGRYLGRGIGVSGGGMAGRIVFTLEDIESWRKLEPDTPLILMRGDTVPDDIREIFEADGLLTGRGGSTSHAAIVAHRLNKTCIVGCSEMMCDENRKTCALGGRVLATGDWLSIDGLEGTVYHGKLEGELKIKERGAMQ